MTAPRGPAADREELAQLLAPGLFGRPDAEVGPATRAARRAERQRADIALAWFATRPAPTAPQGEGQWWGSEDCHERECEDFGTPEPGEVGLGPQTDWPCSHVVWVPAQVEAWIRESEREARLTPTVAGPLRVEWGVVLDDAGSTSLHDTLDQAVAFAAHEDATCPLVRIETWPHAPAANEQESLAVITERDDAEEWADRLAAAIAPPEVLGERSCANNPWQNALDYAATHPAPPGDAEVGGRALSHARTSIAAALTRLDVEYDDEHAETARVALRGCLAALERAERETVSPQRPTEHHGHTAEEDDHG